jgi:hypothetical protein
LRTVTGSATAKAAAAARTMKTADPPRLTSADWSTFPARLWTIHEDPSSLG